MPASGVIKLVDANTWLALAFSDHLHHAKDRAWFGGSGRSSLWFCRGFALPALSSQRNQRTLGGAALP